MGSKVSNRLNDNLKTDRKKQAEALNSAPDREEKSLQKADFTRSKSLGGVLVTGEADSVIGLVQDARYGTALNGGGAGGDFSNKIVIGTGFLNGGKKDGTEIDLTDPNLRYSAGLTIYQRTDTGLDNVYNKDLDEKIDFFSSFVTDSDDSDSAEAQIIRQAESQKRVRKTRKATTPNPQTSVSVVEVNADTVEIKARNGGVNIIAGYDNKIPRFGGQDDVKNLQYVGVSLIGGGNPNTDVLNNSQDPRGLQSIPKGENLSRALQDMANRINDQSKMIKKLITASAALQAVLALHTHPVVGLGAGVAVPSIELATTTALVKAPLDIVNFLTSLTTAYNNAAQRVNMSIVSEGYINSRWNKTN